MRRLDVAVGDDEDRSSRPAIPATPATAARCRPAGRWRASPREARRGTASISGPVSSTGTTRSWQMAVRSRGGSRTERPDRARLRRLVRARPRERRGARERARTCDLRAARASCSSEQAERLGGARGRRRRDLRRTTSSARSRRRSRRSAASTSSSGTAAARRPAARSTSRRSRSEQALELLLVPAVRLVGSCLPHLERSAAGRIVGDHLARGQGADRAPRALEHVPPRRSPAGSRRWPTRSARRGSPSTASRPAGSPPRGSTSCTRRARPRRSSRRSRSAAGERRRSSATSSASSPPTGRATSPARRSSSTAASSASSSETRLPWHR